MKETAPRRERSKDERHTSNHPFRTRMTSKNLPCVFRYPGSKRLLMDGLQPYVEWLADGSDTVLDAFVGGGSVTVWLAANYPRMAIVACDKDPFVAAFWQTIASTDGDVRRLCAALNVTPTLATFDLIRERMASPDALSTTEKAAYAVLDSRLSYSGIQRGGPNGGRRQAGRMKIGSRFNARRLSVDLIALHELLDGRLTAHHADAIELIRLNADIPCLVDPPYVGVGDLLYRVPMSEGEHTALASVLMGVPSWVVTYDDHRLVWDLYAHAAIDHLPVRYGGRRGEDGRWRDKHELVITPADDPSGSVRLRNLPLGPGESLRLTESSEMAMAA